MSRHKSGLALSLQASHLPAGLGESIAMALHLERWRL